MNDEFDWSEMHEKAREADRLYVLDPDTHPYRIDPPHGGCGMVYRRGNEIKECQVHTNGECWLDWEEDE